MSLRVLPTGAIPEGVHHSFDGASLADVVTAMSQLDEAGKVEFHLELDYAHSAGRLTRVDLTMWLTLAMPVWTEAGNRPQAEQDEWSRFLRALRVHEDGHLAICRREAPTAYERLTRSTPARINQVLADEEARIQRLNDQYDHRTDHGRTQQTPHSNTVITVP